MTTEDRTRDSAGSIRGAATSRDAESAPATQLSSGEVACPDCGAIAREPALRHQCTSCGVRFDVLRIQPGIRQPEYSPKLLQARRQEPPPAETIEDLSDGQHVRRLRVRRKPGTWLSAFAWPVATLLAVAAPFEYAFLSQQMWILSALVPLACACIIGLSTWIFRSRSDEVILDHAGLTHIERVAWRAREHHIPLDAIDFFTVGNSYSDDRFYEPCVVLYHGSDQKGRGISGLLGHNDVELQWVARYLASGCALLLDTEPGRFLYTDPPRPQAGADGP